MNPVDLVILIIMLIFILKGLLRGLLSEACSLLGVAVGGFLAFYGYTDVANWMITNLGLSQQLAMAGAFILLFILPFILFSALGFILSKLGKISIFGGIDRIAGGWLGFAQGTVFLALSLFVVQTMGLSSYYEPLSKATLAPPFIELGGKILKNGKKLTAGVK